MNTIGIIGLGIIGGTWAKNYAAGGKLAGTWNRTPQPSAPAWKESPEAVARSLELVEAFRAAGNPGVVGIGGKMFDRPHLRLAERLLARARAAGVI